jgi:hypothetical protein
VAQLGSALRSGRRGRRFKSGHPDQLNGHLRSLQVAFPVRWRIRAGYTAADRPVRVMVSIIPGDALILQYTIPA